MTNRSNHMSLRLIALLALIGVTFSACSTIGAPDDALSNPVVGAESTEVAVTLTEFGVKLSRTDFRIGKQYHFIVTNSGTIPHELMIMNPADPMNMGMDMEALDEMALAVFSEDDMLPGVTRNQIIEFDEPGQMTFEAACHIAGHYEAGMVEILTVTA